MTKKRMSQKWCGVKWTRWVRFSERDFREIPESPGVYRIKPINRNILMYIGQTGRSLRGRLMVLRNEVRKNKMPFNDPHTAAPNLWAWKQSDGMEFECSAARTLMRIRKRKGFESYLIWQYRLDRGESPKCNLGRFHPTHTKSKSLSVGKRGRRLPRGKINPASKPSARPLQFKDSPVDRNWMGRQWIEVNRSTNGTGLNTKSGLYKILHPQTKELLYIGQSKDLNSRLRQHRNNDFKNASIWITTLSKSIPDHRLLELENDLIGAFYYRNRTVPKYQFRGK